MPSSFFLLVPLCCLEIWKVRSYTVLLCKDFVSKVLISISATSTDERDQQIVKRIHLSFSHPMPGPGKWSEESRFQGFFAYSSANAIGAQFPDKGLCRALGILTMPPYSVRAMVISNLPARRSVYQCWSVANICFSPCSVPVQHCYVRISWIRPWHGAHNHASVAIAYKLTTNAHVKQGQSDRFRCHFSRFCFFISSLRKVAMPARQRSESNSSQPFSIVDREKLQPATFQMHCVGIDNESTRCGKLRVSLGHIYRDLPWNFQNTETTSHSSILPSSKLFGIASPLEWNENEQTPAGKSSVEIEN